MGDGGLSEGVEFDVLDDALASAIESMNEQMERELRGAWRAGYDYLHVYEPVQPLARQELTNTLSLKQFVLPTDYQHAPRPDGTRYLYTYDIGAVPDTVIRAAIQAAAD